MDQMEWGKMKNPNPKSPMTKWRYPKPDEKQKSVNVQERQGAVGNQQNISKFPPTIAGKYPNYFWNTSLKGIAYACNIFFSFGQIQPSEILTSPKEEKLESHHGNESNVVRV